eukprot:CAMPEP_0197022964 /NCGR_PEP_ID=MMETSP1384-20130603/3761_1 /TAXON_ID=29189 /ORGANISM="Ammonia sp." /LENGTH=511 /DNA_ID=CAMNT_0042451097 /DNA_START=23 /DNA_END=1558 /DNA_ORIENTATION=-
MDNTQAVMDDENEAKNDTNPSIQDKVSTLLEIARCQFFVIKNDQRKELASGRLQIITDEPDHNELVFVFPDFPKITHTLSVHQKRPIIKMCQSDYIFIKDALDSFGLFIDANYMGNLSNIIQQFESLITQYCHFRVSSKQHAIHKYPINDNLTVGPPDQVAIAGMKLAQMICKGSVATAKGIRKATLYGSKGISKSKRYLLEKLSPNEESTKISPRVQNVLAKAQLGGKAVVKVSGAVLTGVIATANAVSNEVADAVADTKLGKKLTEDAGPKTEAAKQVVKSTVAGAYTVYDELVTGGLHLVRQSSHATAEVLGFKYGDEVHRAAESTAEIVDSAAQTAVNVNKLGYKALAKRIAANSTVDVLSDEQERKDNRESRVGVNPMHALQGLAIANDMANQYEQKKLQKRQNVQRYVGIEGLEESEDNYQVVQNDDDVYDQQYERVMQLEVNGNGQSDVSNDSRSGMNDEPPPSYHFNNYNGDIDFSVSEMEVNNEDQGYRDVHQGFDDTLDVD